MALRVADHWFEVERLGDGLSLIWEPHVVPLLRCNIWHLRGRDRDLMIDTGTGLASLRSFAADILGQRVTAVATHVHLDHVGGHHEFDDCLVHAAEAEGLRQPPTGLNLIDAGFDAGDLATLLLPAMEDFQPEGPMVTALPAPGFALSAWRLRPAGSVATVAEGDVIDLGDRAFEVLHLPGHSPGGIGLWEARTGTLFSGDAIYDGPLIDNLPHSDIAAYARTLDRLRRLPVEVVHAGHDPSFGRDRLLALIEAQMRRWDAAGQPAPTSSGSACPSG